MVAFCRPRRLQSSPRASSGCGRPTPSYSAARWVEMSAAVNIGVQGLCNEREPRLPSTRSKGSSTGKVDIYRAQSMYDLRKKEQDGEFLGETSG